MKIDVFPRYSELGASSRLRCFRWQKYWEQYAIASTFHPFFDDSYLQRIYSGAKRSAADYLKSLIRRMIRIMTSREKFWYIEYELLPGIPAAVELAILRNRKYILGFDDRVEMKYAGNRFLKDKYAKLISKAAGVVCANSYLSQWARQYNTNVIEIPTVVEIANYPASAVEKNPQFTVVWIGNPATRHYLENAAPILQKTAESIDFELLAIGIPSLQIPGVKCRCAKWSEAEEGKLLASAHVGIMPLPADDPFAIGKSAYKLIQYMAAGIPAVASPVGENIRVVQEGITGFTAATAGEWQTALSRLAEDADLRQQTGCNARRIAAEKYSYAAYAGKFAGFITQMISEENR